MPRKRREAIGGYRKHGKKKTRPRKAQGGRCGTQDFFAVSQITINGRRTINRIIKRGSSPPTFCPYGAQNNNLRRSPLWCLLSGANHAPKYHDNRLDPFSAGLKIIFPSYVNIIANDKQSGQRSYRPDKSKSMYVVPGIAVKSFSNACSRSSSPKRAAVSISLFFMVISSILRRAGQKRVISCPSLATQGRNVPRRAGSVNRL